jgi:hypothetical protein
MGLKPTASNNESLVVDWIWRLRDDVAKLYTKQAEQEGKMDLVLEKIDVINKANEKRDKDIGESNKMRIYVYAYLALVPFISVLIGMAVAFMRLKGNG